VTNVTKQKLVSPFSVTNTPTIFDKVVGGTSDGPQSRGHDRERETSSDSNEKSFGIFERIGCVWARGEAAAIPKNKYPGLDISLL